MLKRLLAWLTAGFLFCAGLEGGYRALLWVGCGFRSAHGPAMFEMYTVGESTPAGEPYPGLSLPLLVSTMFGGEIAGREIAVTNLAKRGQSIYPQAVALERVLRCRHSLSPGVVFIYSGHNDAEAAARTPFFEFFKEDILFRSILLRDLFYLAERNSWIARIRTIHTYEHHLRRVIELSLSHGLTPILSTVVSNISGIDPGFSTEEPLPPDAETALNEGERLEARGDYRAALAFYKRASEHMPGLRSYLRYRIGRCHEKLGEYASAKRYYQACIDQGGKDNFARATSRQNDLIRALAKEYRIPLVDAVRVFEASSPHGILGDDLFADGHHPNIRGHILLAGAFARAVSTRYSSPVKDFFPDPEKLFAALSYGKDRQVDAFINSGRWLFTAAVKHARPERRLDLAESRFRGALALEPDNFSAFFGLALVNAARRRGFLSDPANLAWLGRHNLFYGLEYTIPARHMAQVLQKLKYSGVPNEQLKGVLKAYKDSFRRVLRE